MEKIIKPVIGLFLIAALAYTGLGALIKSGETVTDRMEARATELKQKACKDSRISYQKSQSEKAKLAMQKACKNL